MKKDAASQPDATTEERIKEAARIVFTKKGYAATRTRDIAEEAGIGLALLNYYFRTKEKLFDIIMIEKMQKLFGIIGPVLTDPDTTLETKIETIVENYIDMLSRNPHLPIFVLSEIRSNPERFEELFQPGKILRGSAFVQQLHARNPDLHPVHFIFNILGMALFPYIGMPVFQTSGGLDTDQFAQLMEERKKLIPQWLNAMLNC